MPELNKIQQEIREKLVVIAKDQFQKDYNLSNQDIGDIFGISRQAVYQIEIKQRSKKASI